MTWVLIFAFYAAYSGRYTEVVYFSTQADCMTAVEVLKRQESFEFAVCLPGGAANRPGG